MITRQAIEQQLQAFDTTRPDIWLSYGWWSWLREIYKSGLQAWFFLTHEEKIKKLAERHKSKPQPFRAALNRIMERHAEKLGLPLVVSSAPPPDSLPEGISQRQLIALADFIPIMQQVFLGGPEVAKSLEPRPKQILRTFRAFAANRAGRKAEDKYEVALRLYLDGQKSMHTICQRIEPTYTSKLPSERLLARQRMRSAIKRRLIKRLRKERAN
jgi:hypothetical protein